MPREEEALPTAAAVIAAAGAAAKRRRAFVTFLAGAGDYVKGVVGLCKSLRCVDSRYDLIVSVLPDVPRHHIELLLAHGCIVRPIQPVLPPPGVCSFAMPHYVINYSKLRMWEVSFLRSIKTLFLQLDSESILPATKFLPPAVRRLRSAALPRRGHDGVRQHRRALRRIAAGELHRRRGLLLREDLEPYPAVQARLLPAMPGSSPLGLLPRRSAQALLQRRDVRLRAEPEDLRPDDAGAGVQPPDALRGAGFPQPVLPGRLPTRSERVQLGAGDAVEAPRERFARKNQSRPLLRNWFEALGVHRRWRQHGSRRRQGAGSTMVGSLQHPDHPATAKRPLRQI